MIKYLQIENFKSLKRVGLPLERLNLLFGVNGAGKSSVVQSLLLLRQSYWKNNKNNLRTFHINGELIELGSARDILCNNAENEQIRFWLGFNGGAALSCEYDYSSETGQQGSLTSKAEMTIEPVVSDEGLFSQGFFYLGAEHLGPKNSYDSLTWRQDGINLLGSRGEYAVPFLAKYGEAFKVPDELCHENGKTNRLFDQLSAWVSEISPGIRISTSYLSYEERVQLNISYSGKRLESANYSPVNVGFGIPYVLPLVELLLISDDKSILLLENPESHLHPRGQSKIAELIARSTNHGAQIICESHSDHIINGIRVAIKEKKINNGDVSIHYFTKNADQDTVVEPIVSDASGGLSSYPVGLLDEWGHLMEALI